MQFFFTVTAFCLISAMVALATPAKERPNAPVSKLGKKSGEGVLFCSPNNSESCEIILATEGRMFSISNTAKVRHLLRNREASRVNFSGEVTVRSIFGLDQMRLSEVKVSGNGPVPTQVTEHKLAPGIRRPDHRR